MIFHAFDVSADGNVEAKVTYFSFSFLAKRKKVNLKL